MFKSNVRQIKVVGDSFREELAPCYLQQPHQLMLPLNFLIEFLLQLLM